VEHPCHRCGEPVEDGVAFCKKCGAPQIRVPGAVPDAASLPQPDSQINAAPGWSSEIALPAPGARGRISWSQAFPLAVFAGLLEALFSLSLFGVGMLVGGFLSVALYRRRRLSTITAGMGARLGLVSGGLGFAIFCVIRGAGILIFHTGTRLHAEMLQALDQAAARNPDPQAQAMLQYFKSSEGLPLVIALALVATFISFLLFSTLGGLLGGVTLGRKSR